MESSREKKIYAVVEFVISVLDSNKKEVDLVPSKWILEENGALLCQYPPIDDYDKLEKYVQELRDAKENWAKYPVNILTYADNYSKGQRRLKRSYKTTEIRSSDDDNSQTVDKELNAVPAMIVRPSADGKHPQSKKKIPADGLRPIAEDNEVFDFESLKDFINTKINQQTELFHRYLTSEKKSLQYDLKKYFDEIKNTLVANNLPVAAHESVSGATETLAVTLPFKQLEDFQNFDAELKVTLSKRKALLVLFRVKIYGENTAKKCIAKMSSALLTKNVEKHYSGTGKIIKGVGKLNFSNTETFLCMKEVVMEKFGDSEECKNFAGKVGKWLSGHCDREHGRKERCQSV